MILPMARPRSHDDVLAPTRRRWPATWVLVAVVSAGLLLAPPGFTQSTPAPARPSPSTPPGSIASSPSSAPAAVRTRPDKGRARSAYQAGRRAEQAGDWKAEFAAYTEAATYDPANREYAMLKEHARFQVVQSLVEGAERQAIAGNIPGARSLLLQALDVDPNYEVARERLGELTPSAAETGEETDAPKSPRLAGPPRLILTPGRKTLDYRGTTRGAYEEIGRQFGVKMVFDGDLPDRAVHLEVPGVDFDTAVEVLSIQTRTFTRVVDAHTMFITEDTPQKEKEYTLEVEKELLLPASVSNDEMNEDVRMIREMTGISRTQLNTATRTLTVRSSEQNVALAQKLLDQIEQPHGELMLDIDILELDRTVANQLGVTPPTSSSVFALTLPEIQQLQTAANNGTLIQILQGIFGSSAVSSATGSALPALIAFGGGKTIFLATMPGISANFGTALSTVHSAQRVLMRAQDGKPATFFVGDRYPIDLGLLSSGSASPSAALAAALLSGLSLPRTDYATGTAPVSVAIATFNTKNGGHPDIVVANQKGVGTACGPISILVGNGDGTFAACTNLTSGLTITPAIATPSAVAVGDFNDDGFPDIAVTDSTNNNVLIFLGNGDGTFQAPAAYSTGKDPVALVAQDFDSDGQPDLAIVNQADNTVTILLGNKVNGVQTGTFGTPPGQTAPPAVGALPTAIATGAFLSGNSNADLAVTNSTDNTVSVLMGNGDGTFGAQTVYATGKNPAGVTTGDFNGDGQPDLAVSNETDGTVSILMNKNDGSGTFFGQNTFTTGASPTGIISAVFAGTTTDLAVADDASDNVDILVGNGDGTFNTPISLATGNGPVAVAGQDLNGDGSIDLVSANNQANTVTVTLNTVGSSNNLSSQQTAYPSAEYEDLGLKIKATPRLHDDDEVTLQLEFDIKSLTGASINQIPILSNRQIEQTIRLKENETSILSGLIQSNDLRTTNGWPWTSTAPGIGLLTGENTANIQQSELLILVTPRALQLPPHDAPAVYAGRGEPATPPSPPLPPPGPQGAPVQRGLAGEPGPNQPPPGRAPFVFGGQPGQTPAGFPQPGQPTNRPPEPQQPQPQQQQQQQQQPQPMPQ